MEAIRTIQFLSENKINFSHLSISYVWRFSAKFNPFYRRCHLIFFLATVYLSKWLNLDRRSVVVMPDNQSNSPAECRLLEIPFWYPSGSFKEFSTTVLLRLVSPAIRRWPRPCFCNLTILPRSNSVIFSSFLINFS